MTGTSKIPGVLSVRTEPLDEELFVTYDATVTDEATLLAAIKVVVDNVEH